MDLFAPTSSHISHTSSFYNNNKNKNPGYFTIPKLAIPITPKKLVACFNSTIKTLHPENSGEMIISEGPQGEGKDI